MARRIPEVEGGGSGAGMTRVPCCEAGKCSNLCVQYAAPVLPEQGALCHKEYGSDHSGWPIIRNFESAEQQTSLEASSISESESVPPEDGVDWFRNKED